MRNDYMALSLLLFFGCIGLLMMLYGGLQFIYYYRGRWSPARGTVIEAKPEWSGEGDAEHGLYHPYVRYSYRHHDQLLESEQFYPMGNEYMANFAEIQRFLGRYYVGAEIGIFINSANGKAVVVLDKAHRSRAHFLAVVMAGAGLILTGLIFLWIFHSRGWH